MNRLWRRIGGWAGIVALVFAQMAVSVYACPSAPPEAMPQASADTPCHQVDRGNANLCQKHCHDSQQSQHASPAVPDAFVPGFVATVDLPLIGAPTASAWDRALLHATSPPASIRNCCLRI
jgi:hypothetical protein